MARAKQRSKKHHRGSAGEHPAAVTGAALAVAVIAVLLAVTWQRRPNPCAAPPDPATAAWKPGDLHQMFAHVVQNAPGNKSLTDEDRILLNETGMPLYTVTVHSWPGAAGPEEPGEISLQKDLSRPPWVVSLDNLLTTEECQALIELGYNRGYVQSTVTDPKKKKHRRTSQTSWCGYFNGCPDLPIPSRIYKRMGRVTGIHPNHGEDMQFVKYNVGQEYTPHSDYVKGHRDGVVGPRILTFFLYLNDVEEGGETQFSKLDLKIAPKCGRAVLWPNVFNSQPLDKDHRMEHGGMPVTAGVKYGANVWIHLYDYRSAIENKCI